MEMPIKRQNTCDYAFYNSYIVFVCKQTGVSKEEAKVCLEKTNWQIIDAIYRKEK